MKVLSKMSLLFNKLIQMIQVYDKLCSPIKH